MYPYRPDPSGNRTLVLAFVLVALCVALWAAIFLDNPHAYEAWDGGEEADDEWVFETDHDTGTMRQVRRSTTTTGRTLGTTRTTTPTRTTTTTRTSTTNNTSRSSSGRAGK